MQKRRGGIGPAAAEYINFEQELRFRIDHDVQPFTFATTSICF
jgi:hypothetical protein